MTDLKDTPEETDSTSSIICPWCFHQHFEPEEFPDYNAEETRNCAMCSKPFTYHAEVVVTYYAKPVMEDKP